MAPNYGSYSNIGTSSYFNNPNSRTPVSQEVEKDRALWESIGWYDSMKELGRNADARQNGSSDYLWSSDYNQDSDRQDIISAFIFGSNNEGDARADKAATMGKVAMQMLPFLLA